MTAPTDSELFLACRARVQALLAAHVGRDVVQRAIEAFPLPYEEQSALWLWASPRIDSPDAADDGLTVDSERRRQIVIDRLTALG